MAGLRTEIKKALDQGCMTFDEVAEYCEVRFPGASIKRVRVLWEQIKAKHEKKRGRSHAPI